MKASDLQKIVNGGASPAVQINEKFLNDIFCDGYVEAGMRARVVSLTPNSKYKDPGAKSELLELVIDYSEFDAHNKQIESANYYDKDQKPTLTAREAGHYNVKESFYIDADLDLTDCFTFLNNNLFSEYQKTAEQITYVEWLEKQVVDLRLKQKDACDETQEMC